MSRLSMVPARLRTLTANPADARSLHRGSPLALCILVMVAIGTLPGCTSAMLGSAAASAAATAASNQFNASKTQPQTPEQKADPLEAARLRIELASLYYSRGSLGPALEEASSAAKLDPENPQAYNLLGLINMQMSQDGPASSNFERALRLAPADPDINNNYGWYLCERGRPAESIKHFQVAVRSPLYASVDRSLVNAGICSRRGGNDVEARRFFEQALVVRPNQPVALFNLAELAFAGGRLPDSRTFLERYMQAAAPTAEVLWLGVRIERALGDRKSEAVHAQQLRRLFPNAPETQLLSQQGGR